MGTGQRTPMTAASAAVPSPATTVAFHDTFVSRLDAKRRVSIPATYRTALAAIGAEELTFSPSPRHPCVDIMPRPVFEAMAQAQLAGLDEMSEDYEDLAATLYAESTLLRLDPEGRVQLPERLVGHVGITGEVAFRGLGRKFQLWAAEAVAAASSAARERTSARKSSPPPAPPSPRAVVLPFPSGGSGGGGAA